MKIFVDARYIMSEFTGIGIYSHHLLRSMMEQDKSHEYIVAIHDSAITQPDFGPRCEVRRFDARPVSFDSLLSMHRDAREAEADIYHSLCPLVPLGWKGPLVSTVFDLQPLLDPQFTAERGLVKRWAYDQFYRIVYPLCMRRSAYVLTSSYATKRDIQRLVPDVAERTHVIGGGVVASDGAPSQERIDAVSEKYDLPERFLFYLGSTRPNKNLINMLRAFDLFRKSNPEAADIQWVLAVSPDRFFEPFLAEASRRSLLKNVKILSQVSDAEKHALFSMAEALYFVTKYEGFGLPVLEAQAAGLPVICSAHSALGEIADANNALILPPDSPEKIAAGLHRFFANATLRKQLADAGPPNARRFTWNRVAREVLDLYDHVLVHST